MFQEAGSESSGGAPEGGNSGDEAMGANPSERGQENMFEVSPEAQKKFQDQQAAVQQLWKTEKKFRQDDTQIANIIIKFLQDPAHTKFFIIIARLVALNVPSVFLLAIIALINTESADETNLALAAPKKNESNEIKDNSNDNLKLADINETKLVNKNTELNMPPHVKIAVNEWTNNIYLVGKKYPMKTSKSLINRDGTITPNLFKLGTHVLEEYLEKTLVEANFENIYSFIETVFTKFVQKYIDTVEKQRKLN